MRRVLQVAVANYSPLSFSVILVSFKIMSTSKNVAVHLTHLQIDSIFFVSDMLREARYTQDLKNSPSQNMFCLTGRYPFFKYFF